MTVVKNHEAERFLARLPAHVFLYLLFGTDPGLVSERAQKILKASVDNPRDPFQFVRIKGDELAGDPWRLADEAHTVPLFGAKRAILIEAEGKAFLNAIEPLFKAPPRECTIIIEAGTLKKDAPLRILCERDKNAAAIQCYPDSAQDLERLIVSEVSAAGQMITPEAKAFLTEHLGQDRLTTRSEIEKLLLYTHGTSEIGFADVEAIVSDAAIQVADKAVHAAFEGDFPALDAGLQQSLGNPADCGSLLAAALRHALDLHRARSGSLEPDGFRAAAFGRREIFERHLHNWTQDMLFRATNLLDEAIARTRREPRLAPALAARALMTLARMAKRKDTER
ncbi:MAG: DNA polymerase III subunit delta [Alphaproteobacteria bacterium]|nr:DNA polymerase III subunit delta [Alphaproteobacteria bacterium]